MQKKSVLAVLLATAMVGTMIGCGSSSSSDSKESSATTASSKSMTATSQGDGAEKTEELSVGCVVKFQHEFFSALMQGAEDASNELGLSFKGVAPKAVDDVDGQVAAVEDMVISGVDILLVAPSQEETLYKAFDEAVASGAKIIAVDTDLTGYEGKTAYAGTNNKEAMKTAGTELAKLLPEGANVIILRGHLGDATHEMRSEGATEGLEEAGCNILEVKDCGSTAEKAAAAMEDFMVKYPDQIDGVLCCDDDTAAGAIQAIKQAGMMDSITVSGFDGTKVGINNVADGAQAFDLSQNPYEMGYQGVYAGYAAIKGDSFEEEIDTGVQMITIDNYKDFQD